MPTSEAETILADVESAWAPLQAEVDALGEARLEEPTVAGWTAKELLSHVAFWAEAVEGFVTSAWRNRPLPEGWTFGSGYVPASDGSWPHFQVHNDREAAWARERTHWVLVVTDPLQWAGSPDNQPPDVHQLWQERD